jgi:hypothetical protein
MNVRRRSCAVMVVLPGGWSPAFTAAATIPMVPHVVPVERPSCRHSEDELFPGSEPESELLPPMLSERVVEDRQERHCSEACTCLGRFGIPFSSSWNRTCSSRCSTSMSCQRRFLAPKAPSLPLHARRYALDGGRGSADEDHPAVQTRARPRLSPRRLPSRRARANRPPGIPVVGRSAKTPVPSRGCPAVGTHRPSADS